MPKPKLVRVIDKSKIPYDSHWTYLLDHVPVKQAIAAGYIVDPEWVTKVPESEIRSISYNEAHYLEHIKEDSHEDS